MAKTQAQEQAYTDRSYKTKTMGIKKVGREPGMKGVLKSGDPDPNVTTFLATKKRMMLLKSEPRAEGSIIFSDYMYITNNKEDIEWLKEHPAYGVAFWQDKYPKHIADKLKADKEALTRVTDFFEAADV